MEPEAAAPRLSLARLLSPRSVAIVGASASAGSFGASILKNLEDAAYAGAIHLVNPKRTDIDGRPCLATIDALPEGVDCAVLAIPSAGILEAVQACTRRRVGAAIIFSAGFAESGEAGRTAQDAIANIAREHGLVIDGPNCLGIVNYADRIPLTFIATTTEQLTAQRGIAIVSQSGAMAAVLGVSLKHHGLALSYSISTGNEACTHVEDYVEYLIDDPGTAVLTLIVEHFRQPKKFLEQAKRAAALGKRIVLLHPGRSHAARASAATHTGALAGDYLLMRTKVEHAGVIVAESLEELIDISQVLLRSAVLPAGGTVVFTESGAFKALSLDLCEGLGLALPNLSLATEAALRNVLPAFIPPTNPLDLTAQGLVDPDLYRRTLPPVLNDASFGSVILSIILTDEATATLKLPPIIEALRTIRADKPILFAALDEGATLPLRYLDALRDLNIPFFATPERAFRAVARITAASNRLTRYRALSAGNAPTVQVPSGTIPEYASKRILSAAGIATLPGELAQTLAQAELIAASIGYPVVLKAQSPALSHKSDAGGVALNLQSPDQLASAWEAMMTALASAHPLDGILVEKMGQRGVELIVGAQRDADWGLVMLVGFGGVLAEATNDVRLLPPELCEDAIVEELMKLKSAALLRGFRGSPACDVRACARIVSRLAQMMMDTPAIVEVDINPVVVYAEGKGAVALDALMVAAS